MFKKLYRKIILLEDHKLLPPKYSYALKDIAKVYDIFEKDDTPHEYKLVNMNNNISSLSSQIMRSVSTKQEIPIPIDEEEEPDDQAVTSDLATTPDLKLMNNDSLLENYHKELKPNLS